MTRIEIENLKEEQGIDVKAAHQVVRKYRNVKKLYGDRYLRWLLGDRAERPERGTLSFMGAQAVNWDVHGALTGAGPAQRCNWALCPNCFDAECKEE